jgi:MFS family permease
MRLGHMAALGALLASIGYGVPQVLQVFGLLPDPLDRILIFALSLALAPCFVLALAAAYEAAPPGQRPLRFAALALALLYAGFVSIVYVNQLGVVIPRALAGDAGGYARFACCGFREPMTVIDLLGYTYMSLATLLLAPTYERALRWALLLNGLLAIPIFLQLFWPALIWLAAPWLVLFPAAMLLLARTFRQARA